MCELWTFILKRILCNNLWENSDNVKKNFTNQQISHYTDLLFAVVKVPQKAAWKLLAWNCNNTNSYVTIVPATLGGKRWISLWNELYKCLLFLLTLSISFRVKEKIFIPVNATTFVLTSSKNRFDSTHHKWLGTAYRIWKTSFDSSLMNAAENETSKARKIKNTIENQ